VAQIDGVGFIETTWHHLRGQDWVDMYKYGVSAAWGTDAPVRTPMFDTNFAALLRLVGHDMKVTDQKDTGHLNYQIPPAWWIENNERRRSIAFDGSRLWSTAFDGYRRQSMAVML